VKKFPLILLALLAFLALPSRAAVVGTNTLALTNIATSSTLTGSSFIMNTRISGSLMGTRQVPFATVEAAFSNLVSEASITNIAATLDTAVSNSLRSFTLTVGLANTNNTTAVSNSLRSLSLALAASGSNNVTALSNSLYALIGTGDSGLTNANSTFTPLISTGAVKTISAGSNVTITDNGSNVVIAASLSGGAASLGDVTNTVNALSILASGGTGANTTLTNATLLNPSLSGGDWNAVVDTSAAWTNRKSFMSKFWTNSPILHIASEEMETDSDDYGHIAAAAALHQYGVTRLLAVTTDGGWTNQHTNQWFATRGLLRYLGLDQIPVGTTLTNGITGTQTGVADYVVTNYVRNYAADILTETPRSAVSVVREALAAAPNGSVVWTIGSQARSFREVWDSPPDGYSGLPGYQLITNKVREISVALGNYSNGTLTNSTGTDYNDFTDPIASATFNRVSNVLVTYVDSGLPTGVGVNTIIPRSGQTYYSLADSSPLKIAFKRIQDYEGREYADGRPAWGKVYALVPFFREPMGMLVVTGANYFSGGTNYWTNDPTKTLSRYAYAPTNNPSSTTNLYYFLKEWEGRTVQGLPPGRPIGTDFAGDYKFAGRTETYTTFFPDIHFATNYPAATSAGGKTWLEMINGSIGINYASRLFSDQPSSVVGLRFNNQALVFGYAGQSYLSISNQVALRSGIRLGVWNGSSEVGSLGNNAANDRFTDQTTNTLSIRFSDAFAVGGSGNASLVLSNKLTLRRGIPMLFEASSAVDPSLNPSIGVGSNSVVGLLDSQLGIRSIIGGAIGDGAAGDKQISWTNGTVTLHGSVLAPNLPTNSPTAVASLQVAADGTAVKGPISIAQNGGTGTNTTLLNPTVRGLDLAELDGQELLIILHDSNGDANNDVAGTLKYVTRLREMTEVSNRLQVLNYSFSGTTLQAHDSAFASRFDFLTNYPSVRKRWAIMAARNDLASGRTLAQMTNNAISIATKALAFSNTTHIYIGPFGGTAGVDLPTKTNYNAWARTATTNGAFQGYWDFSLADPYLGTDAVHYTAFGQYFMATNIVSTTLTNLASTAPIQRVGSAMVGSMSLRPPVSGDVAMQITDGILVVDNAGNKSFSFKNGTNEFLFGSPNGSVNKSPWFQDTTYTFRGGINSSGDPTNRLNISSHAGGTPFLQSLGGGLQLWAGAQADMIISNTVWRGTNTGTTIRLGPDGPGQYAVSPLGTYNPAPDYYVQGQGASFYDSVSNVVGTLSYDGTKVQLSMVGTTPWGIYSKSGTVTALAGDSNGVHTVTFSSAFPTNTGTLVAGLYQDDTGKLVKGPVSSGGDSNTVFQIVTNIMGNGSIDSLVVAGTAEFQDVISGDGSGLTNLIRGPTVSAGANVTVTLSKNPDGSTNYQVAASGGGGSADLSAFKGYIYGLGLYSLGTNQIGFRSGGAWIEASNAVVAAASDVSTNVSGLTPSTWHHAYFDGGTGGLLLSTTGPATAFIGTARSMTGNTSRRWLGAVLTDSGGGIRSFQHVPQKAQFTWGHRWPGSLVLSNGTSTVSTNIDFSGAVPPQSFLASVLVLNTATNAAIYLGVGGETVDTSATGNQIAVNSGRFETPEVVLSTNQTLSYIYATTPSGGAGTVGVRGFTLER
jgi:hypothetical protein